MKNRYITVSQRLDLSQLSQKIHIDIEEHINEIIEIITENPEYVNTILTKYEEKKKAKLDLLLKYPEIEQYKCKFDYYSLVILSNKKSYIITDLNRIFSKTHKSDMHREYIDYKEWSVVLDSRDMDPRHHKNMIDFCSSINLKSQDDGQFIKNEGDFVIQWKTV
jgi:DUF4097 and DUF4098 domain-containing protein YvlB